MPSRGKNKVQSQAKEDRQGNLNDMQKGTSQSLLSPLRNTETTASQNISNECGTKTINTADMLGQSREVLYGERTYSQNQFDAQQSLQNINTPWSGQKVGQIFTPQAKQLQHNGQLNQNMQAYSVTGAENNVPPWAINLCQQVNNIQLMLDNHTRAWQFVENTMSAQNEKLMRMESLLSEVTNIKKT
jgi:hypothetical protein